MNEAETRAGHIYPALAAGCGIVEGGRIRREYHITLEPIESHSKRDRCHALFTYFAGTNHHSKTPSVASARQSASPGRDDPKIAHGFNRGTIP